MNSRAQSVTHEQVDAIGRCQRMLPTEADFAGKKGYSRKYRQDGTYEWKYSYTTNRKGNLTREAGEVLDMMRPFSRADTERHATSEARKPRVAMKDRQGRVNYLDPGQADAAARRNGWGHHWRAGGARVVAGPQGMLFRCAAGAWEPLGVRCLGTPLRGSARVPRRGIQRDPDGNPWQWVSDEWRRVTE